MSKILVHIHSGPDLKNKATLGMLVAVSAIKDGHDVSLFFAADGVHLLNCSEAGKVVGEGTGDLKEHLDFLQSANTTLWISLPDEPGKLGDVTTIIGTNNVNISSVEMVEKTKNSINFRFNLIIHDLKNFTKLISELKQKEYNFKIIRHKNKKYAFFKKLFGGFKKN